MEQRRLLCEGYFFGKTAIGTVLGTDENEPGQVCPIERKQVLYEYGGVYADLDTVSSSDGTNFFITSSSKVALAML